ncbi:C4-dicarboxylate ABC transporter substrate-binding protein [Methylobacterium oryzihabitans]|uniref:C4-dicarboxylate ABC transporter substrate-binding protein n=2 Tax=Methylobacterium oryzihabitans TaxID=2499852 RepID=A0A3S2V739_9HYPH|nr:C4-dicarboxylate ABC transporter substrate-binding protein [Methylobacterium oryzihabitans]
MAGPGAALEPEAAPPSPPARKSPARPPEPLREAVNAWTLGLAGGLLEGAPLRLAVDIARVVDAGEDLHVLPIVTRGPAENLESLLYLKGVDLAIVNSDSLARFRPFVPNLRRRIAYVLNLVPSELHVFVRPEIRSMGDLAGRKVNFNTPGTAAAYSGPIVFERLGVAVEKTFLPHPSAVEAMKRGEIAAVVFVTSKPVDAFARSAWGPGYHFLPVAYDKAFETDYLPSTLTSADYPALIAPGETVPTIAVSTFLAAYAWPKDASRHARMARLVDRLFGRIEALQAPGFHPKWADVDVAAEVAGLDRLPAAQAWLDRNRPRPAAAGQAAAGAR